MHQGAVIAYLSGIASYNSKVRDVERNLKTDFGTIIDCRVSAHVFPKLSLFFKAFMLVALEVATGYNTVNPPALHKRNVSKSPPSHIRRRASIAVLSGDIVVGFAVMT